MATKSVTITPEMRRSVRGDFDLTVAVADSVLADPLAVSADLMALCRGLPGVDPDEVARLVLEAAST